MRRVLKASYKGVKYEAKTDNLEVAEGNQASDYYVALYDQAKDVAHMIKVDQCYQFNQVIERFQEELRAARDGQEEQGDNEALKNMTYMDKKKQLVEAFGTKKSLKKVTSLLTNMIGEDGITQKADKGIRDSRLTKKASIIAEE